MKAMKFVTILLMLLSVTIGANAQDLSKAQRKTVKKQVKTFQDEGWKVKPGMLPLADQIAHSIQTQSERDAKGNDKWIVGEGSSVGKLYDAARIQALTVAQGEVSRRMKVNMTAQIELDLANEQFTKDEAESIAKTIITTMGKTIDQKITQPNTLMECYRKLPNGNIEVLIRIAISSETMDGLSKSAIEQALRDNRMKRIDENKTKMQ